MTLRIIEAHADKDALENIEKAAEKHGVIDSWTEHVGRERILFSALVRSNASQPLIDALQSLPLAMRPTRLLLRPVEATLPQVEEEKEDEETAAKRKPVISGISREELYNRLSQGARLDMDYLLLVILSTIVACIGLLEDNAAVVIGAMVIAPLLGPQLALALGTAIADADLMKRSVRTGLAGMAVALSVSMLIGFFWPANIHGHEIAARTLVGFDNVALALASGAAAVLSLTAGVATALVGVMVAVALLPPMAALGMLVGNGYWYEAQGAALLLAVNVVSINLAAKLVFQFKGVYPRLWYQQQKAKAAMRRSLGIWLATLIILGGLIYLYQKYKI